jgi:hypothetical protein
VYQQPGYGQQPYGAPQGYGQPGFGQGFGAVPPPKKKSPLPWILGGGGVMIVAVVVAVLVATLGGAGDPRPVAQELVDKMNNKDYASMSGMVCERKKAEQSQLDPRRQLKDMGLTEAQMKQLEESMKIHVALGAVTDHGDETATAKISGTINMTFMGQTMPPAPYNTDLNMIVEGGSWKVC